MKRKIVWLALPLALGVLMFGVKWRAEHPTATKKDLELRALLSQSSKIVASYQLIGSGNNMSTNEVFSPKQFEMFVDCFNIASKRNTKPFIVPRPNQKVTFSCEFDFAKSIESGISGIMIGIKAPDGRGWMIVNYGNREERYNLHSATVKSWFELLKANPRVGPKLFAPE